jgi:hypothetical protein
MPPALAADVLAAAAAAGDSHSAFHLRTLLPASLQLDSSQLEAALQAALHCRQQRCEYGSSLCVRRLLELPAAAAVTVQQAARLLADALQPATAAAAAPDSSSSSDGALVVFELCRGLPAAQQLQPHEVARLLFGAVVAEDWLAVQSLGGGLQEQRGLAGQQQMG